MKKTILSIIFALVLMLPSTSCVTPVSASNSDTTTVISTDDVYAATATVAATAILLDYVWAWNGSGYYRYYCAPYYAPRPYYWRGPRHWAPRHWRNIPPRPYRHHSTYHSPVPRPHAPRHHSGGFRGRR